MKVISLFKALLLSTAALTLTLATPAHAGPVSGQGTWETTLQARDLDGNGIPDAFYDTILNITWLRNANVNGVKTWADANTWAAGYSFGGYSDWRLPTMVDTGTAGCDYSFAGGTDCGYNVQTTSGTTVYSEMASLFYDALGNKAFCPRGIAACTEQSGWGLINTGEFQNLLNNFYWSGLEYAPDTTGAWGFGNFKGSQDVVKKNTFAFSMVVRPGDVRAAEVPEPESLALVLMGLAGLGLIRRRQAVGSLAL